MMVLCEPKYVGAACIILTILILQVQGGSNMTGTDLYKRTHKSVPVIFEPPCIL